MEVSEAVYGYDRIYEMEEVGIKYRMVTSVDSLLRNRLRWRAKLLRIFDRVLGLRYFGEICMEAQAFFVRKTYNFQQN